MLFGCVLFEKHAIPLTGMQLCFAHHKDDVKRKLSRTIDNTHTAHVSLIRCRRSDEIDHQRSFPVYTVEAPPDMHACIHAWQCCSAALILTSPDARFRGILMSDFIGLRTNQALAADRCPRVTFNHSYSYRLAHANPENLRSLHQVFNSVLS